MNIHELENNYFAVKTKSDFVIFNDEGNPIVKQKTVAPIKTHDSKTFPWRSKNLLGTKMYEFVYPD